MCAVLHVRPVTRDDSLAFVVRRCFFVGESLRFGSKRLERVGELAALEAVWTRGHNRVMGLKCEAWDATFLWSDGSKVPSTVARLTSENENQTLFFSFTF